MGALVDTALSLGGVLVAPVHTLIQRLAERRITPDVITIFDIQPFNNGWKYPVPGGGYRWKNANSQAPDKYYWCGGKPETATFYHAQDLAYEIAQASGACWFVSGEADTWAMYSAGIRHVLSGFTENQVTEGLAEYLASMGVTTLYIAPDLDQTGARWARLVAQALQDSPIELDARTLPAELGNKGDLGKAWMSHQKQQPFERWLLGLPYFNPDPIPEPTAEFDYQAQVVNYAPIPQEYKALVADILHSTEYQADGFAKKNVHCPFHDDEHPSASLHYEKGLYCQTCGRWFTWNETGIKIGAGSLRTWRVSNTYAVSTELREMLIAAGHSSLARLLDVLSLAGWKAGREFTYQDALEASRDYLKEWTVRESLKQLENYCGFFPPFNLQLVMKEENHNNSGRPPKMYRLLNFDELAHHLGIHFFHFDEMNPQKIKNVADYRAEVYAAFPRRLPGQYSRKFLSKRVGVSTRTGQKYDKKAGLIVTPNMDKAEMSPQELADLPKELPKKRKHNMWLEDEHGKKYPPVKKAIDLIAQDGGGKVFQVQQFTNTYQPGNQQNTSGANARM